MDSPETLKHEDFVFRVEPAPPRHLVTIPPNEADEIKFDRHLTIEEAKDVIRRRPWPLRWWPRCGLAYSQKRI